VDVGDGPPWVKPEIQQGVEEQPESHSHLDPCQVQPESRVRPVAGSDMGFGFAGGVKAIWINPAGFVAIAGCEHQHDRRPRRDEFACQFASRVAIRLIVSSGTSNRTSSSDALC
jgi:hypothetical protein